MPVCNRLGAALPNLILGEAVTMQARCRLGAAAPNLNNVKRLVLITVGEAVTMLLFRCLW